MNAKQSTPRMLAGIAALLLLAAVTGCATGKQRVTASGTCIFFANETSYAGQVCDPNGSMTLLWDDVSHQATGGIWNEETTGPCAVVPAHVVSGTVVQGGASDSTNLDFNQPTQPDTFVFKGKLSADGKTLEGVMDTIPFVAKGETTCTCEGRRSNHG